MIAFPGLLDHPRYRRSFDSLVSTQIRVTPITERSRRYLELRPIDGNSPFSDLCSQDNRHICRAGPFEWRDGMSYEYWMFGGDITAERLTRIDRDTRDFLEQFFASTEVKP